MAKSDAPHSAGDCVTNSACSVPAGRMEVPEEDQPPVTAHGRLQRVRTALGRQSARRVRPPTPPFHSHTLPFHSPTLPFHSPTAASRVQSFRYRSFGDRQTPAVRRAEGFCGSVLFSTQVQNAAPASCPQIVPACGASPDSLHCPLPLKTPGLAAGLLPACVHGSERSIAGLAARQMGCSLILP